MTIFFDLPKIAPRFQLGRSLIETEANKLPEIYPRKALVALASTPRIQGKISISAVPQRPQLRKAAKEILGTISQAARFSQHPEVLKFIKEAEKEFPKIRKLIRDKQLQLPPSSSYLDPEYKPINIYSKDGEIQFQNAEDENLAFLYTTDYVASIEDGIEKDPIQPKIAIDLMKIIEIDGQKIQVNIMPFKHGLKRMDLRMHTGEEVLATTPVFQIFLDKNNSVYDMWMHPNKFVRTPKEINDYPASVNPSKRKLSINVPPGHTNIRIKESA